MNDEAGPNDKRIRILLEALTTISYLKRAEGRAAAIAEYALDQYGRALRGGADAADTDIVSMSMPENQMAYRNQNTRRRGDRRHANEGPPLGLMERRLGGDRRLNPDRRCALQAS